MGSSVLTRVDANTASKSIPLSPLPAAAIYSPLAFVQVISLRFNSDTYIMMKQMTFIHTDALANRHYVKPEEQILILKHLREMRTCTGWETAHKSRSLRIHWGLE